MRRLVRDLRKSGVGSQYRGSLGTAHHINPGFELLGERVDDAGAQARFCLRKNTNRCANPVVRNKRLNTSGSCASSLVRGLAANMTALAATPTKIKTIATCARVESANA